MFDEKSVVYAPYGSALPRLIVWLIRGEVKRQAHAVGMSRHSHEEVLRINQLNLDSLSTYLGTTDTF